MILDLFLSSFLLSVVLVGIHAYFGREIVKRGIIFTDIAVAQLSGVGIALSLIVFHGKYTYAFSLIFGLFASLLIAISQKLKEYSEAFIGLLYALGFSLTVLLLSMSAHGMEELKKLTASDILFVSMEEVIKTAGIYTVLGFLLYLRKRLSGMIHELSFFALFSITLATLLLGRGLVFAWTWGSFCSFVAITFSFWLDLPTGYSLVFLQALVALMTFFYKLLVSSYFHAGS